MNLKPVPRLFLTLSALAAVSLALAACDAVVDDETVAENPPPKNVQQAPPQQPLPEVPPLVQDPQHEIWRPGYWALLNSQFVWVPGQVIPRPSPTAVWDDARWVHHLYGWSFQQGHWE